MTTKKVARTVRLTERQWSILEQLGWGHVNVGVVRILEEAAKREGIEGLVGKLGKREGAGARPERVYDASTGKVVELPRQEPEVY